MGYSGSSRKIWQISTICVLFLCFAALFLWGIRYDRHSGTGQAPSGHQEASVYESVFTITTADRETSDAQAVTVNLSEASGQYTIRESGTYLLTGELNGGLYVDAEEQIVHLILDGIFIHARSGPAIYVQSAGKVIITVRDGTDNVLRDSAAYLLSENENGCIYSNCDLTVNGTGNLDIYGYYKDGIHSKGIVKILGGMIRIQAKRDGIRGNDGILICNDVLQIESEGSGLHTTNIRKPSNGSVEIQGGSHSIISGEYAVHSIGDCYMEECSVYGKGILTNFHIEGDSYIGEGCLVNE